MGKAKKEVSVSILTTVDSATNDAFYELVNGHGIVVAQLTENMKDRMLKDGVPEKIIFVEKKG